VATTPARTRPPTSKSARASVKKGLAPRGKAGPARKSAPGEKQKGLLGGLRKPPVPGLGSPPPRPPGALPGAASFSVNAPPLSAPSAPLGVGHMSNFPQPKGTGANTAPARGVDTGRKGAASPGAKKRAR
jgi:hypothetical protein